MSSEDLRSSSSASSYSRLDDSSVLMDRNITPISTSPIESEEVEQLKLTLKRLKIENEDKTNQKSFTDIEAFKNQLSGEWKLTSSTNVDEYLEKQRGDLVHNILFQSADKNFEFEGNLLKLFDSVGTKKFNCQELEISTAKFTNGSAQLMYIYENCLKIVSIFEDSDKMEEKMFVKDDQLYIVNKRSEIECTRAYKNLNECLKKMKVMEEKMKILKKENKRLTERVKIEITYAKLAKQFDGSWELITKPEFIVFFSLDADLVILRLGNDSAARAFTLDEDQYVGDNVTEQLTTDGIKIFWKYKEGNGDYNLFTQFEVVDGMLIQTLFSDKNTDAPKRFQFKKIT